MKRGEGAMASQDPRHSHRAGHVHVRGDQRKTLPFRACVIEAEAPGDIDLIAGIQRRALGPDEHVLEVELHVIFDAHGDVLRSWGAGRREDRYRLILACPTGVCEDWVRKPPWGSAGLDAGPRT